MRKIVMLISITLVLLSGCSQNSSQNEYYVLVVEGEEDLINKFDKYASVKNPVIEIDYYKNMKDAKKQHPSYNIDQSPVVYIFSIENNDKKLELKTTDIDRSVKMLEAIKER